MGVGGQYWRLRTLRDILHLPLEYKEQSNCCIDSQIFKHRFYHTFVLSVKRTFRMIGMPEDSKFILLLDNCTAHTHEFVRQSGKISVLYLPPNVTPCTTCGPGSHMKSAIISKISFASLQIMKEH